MASFIGGFIALGLSEGSVPALFWAFIAHSLYSRKECDECLLSTSSAPVAGHREILAERGGRFFFFIVSSVKYEPFTRPMML